MLGDHALAYPRTGLLARRAKVVERAWIRVAREAVGPEGQVIPQQSHYSPQRGADGSPPPGPDSICGHAQRFIVLGTDVGGRWIAGALGLVREFVRARECRAPPAVRRAAMPTRRWWSILSVAVQQAVAGTALGCAWPATSPTCASDAPPLERVLDCARGDAGSRLPLRADGQVAGRVRTRVGFPMQS